MRVFFPGSGLCRSYSLTVGPKSKTGDRMMFLLRLLELAVGCSIICVLVFLYEGEEKKIQSRLEDSWIKIDDLKKKAIKRHTAFIQTVATQAGSLLDRLFGKKLLSLQLVGVTLCYSLASLFLVKLWLQDVLGDLNLPLVWSLFLFYLIAGTLPLFFRSCRWLLSWLGIIILSLPVIMLTIQYFVWDNQSASGQFSLPLGVGFLLYNVAGFYLGGAVAILAGSLCIVLTRSALRWSTETKSFLKMVSVLVLNFLLMVGLFLLPLHYEGMLFQHILAYQLNPDNQLSGVTNWGLSMLMWAYDLAVSANLYTSLIAATWIVLIIMMWLHRWFWPAFGRLAYALQRWELLNGKKRKFLLGVGVLLIGDCIGHAPEWLKPLEALF
jgi:hypothetical protein